MVFVVCTAINKIKKKASLKGLVTFAGHRCLTSLLAEVPKDRKPCLTPVTAEKNLVTMLTASTLVLIVLLLQTLHWTAWAHKRSSYAYKNTSIFSPKMTEHLVEISVSSSEYPRCHSIILFWHPYILLTTITTCACAHPGWSCYLTNRLAREIVSSPAAFLIRAPKKECA
jgi:hypothetical protein